MTEETAIEQQAEVSSIWEAYKWTVKHYAKKAWYGSKFAGALTAFVIASFAPFIVTLALSISGVLDWSTTTKGITGVVTLAWITVVVLPLIDAIDKVHDIDAWLGESTNQTVDDT